MINLEDPFSPDRFALDLYASVLEGRGLTRAMEPLARVLGTSTHAVHLMLYERGVLREARSQGGGLAADVTAEYARHWIHHDPWARTAAVSGEGVLNLASKVPARQLRASAIWNEWKAPRDGAFHCLSVLVQGPGGMSGRIAFHRAVRAEGFGHAEAALLQPIFPHLRRALIAETRLAAGDWQSARALQAGFSALRQGVVLLDRQRQIVATNPAVEAMAAQGDGLSLVSDGGLSSQDAPARQALARAVGSALAAIGGKVRMMPDAASVALPRRSGAQPWLVQALPLRRLEAPGMPDGFTGVMLLVTDDTARPRPRAPLLRQAFGLSPAEASLAAALGAGKTVAQHAAARRIAVDTVRGQLLAIRRKTGSRSLAELTALLGRLSG
ncbi:helix-turn-helix transcriptional regulator [Falsiroseomonas sp. E2-1-a20]|uniref:helix-turn-helix transcriptional regulator n=1 Tax=Falsiroseomonas sp. E2-1-a20 TaxID=3239300 RepID=UPI003F3E8C51